MRPILALLLPALALAALLLAAVAPAWADDTAPTAAVELFVLDNGYQVRGRVVRETEDKLVVRLIGLAERNTITLRRSEVRERTVHVDPTVVPVARIRDIDAEPAAAYEGPTSMPRTTRYDQDGNIRAEGENDESDPELEREGFGERLVRVTRMAFPTTLEARLLVGLLALIALGILVGGGARMLGMKAPSLHASTTLGFMLGVFLLGDILLHDEMLRADRAIWVLPLQTGVWLATARALLDAPLSRIVPLFSMVLFAALSLVFLTGSVLVSM